MMSWRRDESGPAYGPLFSAAMGGPIHLSRGLSVAHGSTSSMLRFEAPHGLRVGQGLAFGSEIRFAAAIPDALTVVLNQAFTVAPAGGQTLNDCASYFLGPSLHSVTLFDYWSPPTAVQRIIVGAGVDKLSININGDYHEFRVEGVGRELIDSATFASGSAGLLEFPSEPELGNVDYSIVPGHLGQVWIGPVPQRFYTLTEAQVTIENNLEARAREFGNELLMRLVPGERRVKVSMSLYEKDDAATAALYQAAKQQSPVSIMFQLGQQPGQLCGVWISNLIPDVPMFDDRDTRLAWRFSDARAVGLLDDEIFVAFA